MKQLYKDFGSGDLKGSNTLAFEETLETDAELDDAGQRTHRQWLGRLLWLDRPDIKNAVCQLSTHVETATTRDEGNVERLLRCLVGNPVCNKVVGCKLNVSGLADTPHGSVLVMTDCPLGR